MIWIFAVLVCLPVILFVLVLVLTGAAVILGIPAAVVYAIGARESEK